MLTSCVRTLAHLSLARSHQQYGQPGLQKTVTGGEERTTCVKHPVAAEHSAYPIWTPVSGTLLRHERTRQRVGGHDNEQHGEPTDEGP